MCERRKLVWPPAGEEGAAPFPPDERLGEAEPFLYSVCTQALSRRAGKGLLPLPGQVFTARLNGLDEQEATRVAGRLYEPALRGRVMQLAADFLPPAQRAQIPDELASWAGLYVFFLEGVEEAGYFPIDWEVVQEILIPPGDWLRLRLPFHIAQRVLEGIPLRTYRPSVRDRETYPVLDALSILCEGPYLVGEGYAKRRAWSLMQGMVPEGLGGPAGRRALRAALREGASFRALREPLCWLPEVMGILLGDIAGGANVFLCAERATACLEEGELGLRFRWAPADVAYLCREWRAAAETAGHYEAFLAWSLDALGTGEGLQGFVRWVLQQGGYDG